MKQYISFQQDRLCIFNPARPNKSLSLTYHPFAVIEVDDPKIQYPDLDIEGLLGVKFIEDIPFLVIITEKARVCSLMGNTIYQIKKVDWIPIIVPSQAEEVLTQYEQTYKQMSKLFDEGLHYYSETYPLHLPLLQSQTPLSHEQFTFYDQFIWNKKIKHADKFSSLQFWCKSIIQGYVESFTTILPSHQSLFYFLISRRSNKKAGTRYYSRGINDDGNVANFTETQQIIIYEDFIFSHLQIRGSVPAFFQQVGINGISGELNISRNEAMTQKAFNLHFDSLHKIYNKIFCTNLLSIKKPDEEKLTNFFESMISKYSPPYVKYEYFDFHEECKHNEFENSRKLITKIKQIACSFGFTVINRKNGEIHSKQNGVIRTNCMDCLDRTNYIQSRLALVIFQQIVINFSHFELRAQIQKYHLFENKQEESSILLKQFNKLWGDNGDSISLHYTGIGSTHTDITKNGKRTLAGTVNHKMRSLMRFFTQFTDTKKHQAITKLVKTSSIKMSPNLGGSMEFMNMAIFSYQLTKHHGKKNTFFVKKFIEDKNPILVVVFVYKSSSSNWLKNILPFQKNQQIKAFMDQQSICIKKQGYQIIDHVETDQTCLMIFGKQELLHEFSQIKHETLSKHKDQLVVCKLTLFNSPMVFSGVRCSNFENFKDLLQKSHEQAFQTNKLGKAKSSSILNHNYRIVMGDIGSKIDISEEYMKEIENQMVWMKEKNDSKGKTRLLSEILDKDQFSRGNYHGQTKYLRNYMEGPINFIPQSNRIIFWNMENLIIKVIEYGRNQEEKCMFGEFSLQIAK